MKNLILAFVVLSSTATSFGACVAHPVGGTSASSKMVAGVNSIRGNIKASDLRQKFAKSLFKPSWKARDPRIASSFIKDGDTVVVTSGGSRELSAQYKAYDALLDEREHAKLYGDQHQVWKINAKIREMEAQGLHLPSATKTRVYSNVEIYRMEQILFQQKREGLQVLHIQRIPGKVASTIKGNARNGMLLAATAIALGLVSAEEIASGKIASHLDSELGSLCK